MVPGTGLSRLQVSEHLVGDHGPLESRAPGVPEPLHGLSGRDRPADGGAEGAAWPGVKGEACGEARGRLSPDFRRGHGDGPAVPRSPALPGCDRLGEESARVNFFFGGHARQTGLYSSGFRMEGYMYQESDLKRIGELKSLAPA